MTQLRSSSFVGQAAEDRVQAVVKFGFTERQARFLVTVMLHSGVCLPRQYEAFAGIVHGKRTGRFFRKLIKHGYAAAYPCRHNRGRVYHVHHKPLYRAIGETNSRHRRPMSAARVEEALMLLDAMLIDPKIMWLATAEEKRIHLSRQAGVSADDAARLTSTQHACRPVRSVRDRMPVGIDHEGRWVFLYLLTDLQREDFHWFLQQRSALFAVLPAWVVQIVCLHAKGVAELYEKEARHALQPVSSRAASGLRWYFKLHRAYTGGCGTWRRRARLLRVAIRLRRAAIPGALPALVDRGRHGAGGHLIRRNCGGSQARHRQDRVPRPAVRVSTPLAPGWLASTDIAGGRGRGRQARTVSAPCHRRDRWDQRGCRRRRAGERMIPVSGSSARTSRARALLADATKGGVLCRPTVAASVQQPGRERPRHPRAKLFQARLGVAPRLVARHKSSSGRVAISLSNPCE